MQSYPNAPQASSGAVAAAVEGQRHAESWLSVIRSVCGTGDELFHTVETLVEQGNRAKLRGFCRSVQKRLEASK